ncbi:MAG: TrmH family RNA methyltransferase, partial [Pseudomonadota bacterium]
MHLVLFQPDIAQNVGAAIRTAACFGAGLDIIGPCGFPLSAREINRVAMDYRLLTKPQIYDSWRGYQESETRKRGRLILLTTKARNS